MVKFALFQKWVLDHNKNAKRKSMKNYTWMAHVQNILIRMRPDTIKNLVQSQRKLRSDLLYGCSTIGNNSFENDLHIIQNFDNIQDCYKYLW